MRGILTEVRHAARLLWRDRGFTAVALITLGLGIGASTAMFSVLDRLLIRPLPYQPPIASSGSPPIRRATGT